MVIAAFGAAAGSTSEAREFVAGLHTVAVVGAAARYGVPRWSRSDRDRLTNGVRAPH
jgi:hypothetical protein